MISRVDRYDRSNRIFRIALVASFLVHLIVGYLVYEASPGLRHVLARVVPKPEPTDDVVTLSTALRIEKRAKPAPHVHASAVRVAVRRPVSPTRASEPSVVREPLAAPPVHPKAELAKQTPRSTPAPTSPPASSPPKVVASVQQSERVTRSESQQRSGRLSQAQLARIQADLSKSISRDRAADNPLSNVAKPVRIAAATRRYAVDFAALAGNMRDAQGICDPIRRWQARGWDYYYAACTIQQPDGTVARKAMPWPVRWRPENDPWSGANPGPSGPMPLPPPGWRPSGPVDPDFIPYLRKNGYPI